jgi:hypothetical protein
MQSVDFGFPGGWHVTLFPSALLAIAIVLIGACVLLVKMTHLIQR